MKKTNKECLVIQLKFDQLKAQNSVNGRYEKPIVCTTLSKHSTLNIINFTDTLEQLDT